MKAMYVVKTRVTENRVPWTIAVTIAGHLTGNDRDQAVYSATVNLFRQETTYLPGTSVRIISFEEVNLW